MPETIAPVAADDLPALLATLCAQPGVSDCFVIERSSPQGAALVAFLVVSGSLDAGSLSGALRTAVPEVRIPDYFLPVSTLPLTLDGEIDVEALNALPLIDADLIAQVEAQAGEGQAAFVLETELVGRPPLHLADLLPGRRRARTTREEPAAAQRGTGGTGQPSKHRPAIQRGGPLHTPIPRNLSGALARTVASFGAQQLIYLQEDGSEIRQAYSELLKDAERVLSSLRKLGARPGDRFLFQFRHNQDFILAFWACQLGGFIPIPISIAPTYEQPNATISKLQNAWEMLARPWVLSDRSLAESLRRLPELFDFPGLRVSVIEDLRRGERDSEWYDSAPEDLAIMLFTSGSTGKPKAVRQTHKALLSRSAATSQGTNLSSEDVFFNWMPLDHVGGIVMYHLPGIYLGARQIHIPTPAILQNPLRWLDLIDQYRVTTTWAPNFAFGLLNTQTEEIQKRRWDLSTLVFILNAGESIVARTTRHVLELLIPHGLPATAMRPAWGMSETCSAVTYSDRFTLDKTSNTDLFVQVGAAAPEFAFRIVDSENTVLEEGAIGRLQVSGPSVTLGYDQNPAANAESFTPDGWFITGDLGKIDDGQLTITGRQKEVIIINGVNFYPHELEAVVEEVAGVSASFTAVCAVREEGTDTDGIAVFFHPASEDDAQLGVIIREIRGRMVRISGVNPNILVPLEKKRIPKTEIGKIQRTQLQQRLVAGEFKDVLKHVDVLTESANTIPDWFFEKVWQRRNLAARQAVPANWLVFLGESGEGEALCSHLQGTVVQVRPGKAFSATGANQFVLDPSSPDHYRELFAALSGAPPIDRVVHLATYGVRANSSSNPEDRFLPLLHLIAELTTLAGRARIGLDVVSADSQFVLPSDGQAFLNAALPPLLRAASVEQPNLRTRHVDFSATDVETGAGRLLEELSAEPTDPEVAYRGGLRFVPKLQRSHADTVPPQPESFVRGGLYLLTGGLGGIGVEVARLLITQFDACLLLTGRRPVPTDSELPMAAALKSLESLGQVRYAAVDVADPGALEQAVAEAEQAWNHPLDGILHMAAVYRDGVLTRETSDTLADSFHAKVHGALAIEKLLATRPSALLLAFSSVLSFFPGALVGVYAASNRTLENLVLCLRAKGRRAYAVAWSSWRETGMSRGQTAREALRSKGIREMSVEQAWNSMLLLLRRGSPLMLVGLDSSSNAISRIMAGEPVASPRLGTFFLATEPGLRAQLLQFTFNDRFGTSVPLALHPVEEIPRTSTGAVDRDALVASLRRGGGPPYAEPKTNTERTICGIWQDMLNAPHLGAEDNFFMFGGHSLLATQVMSRLGSLFHVDIPLRSLFDSPTVRGLAAAVDRLRGQTGQTRGTIEPVADRAHLPLSFTQQRLWFLDQWQPGGHVYNVPLVFRVRGRLDTQLLQRSLDAVVARHESLRTTFHAVAGQPVQRVQPFVAVPVLEVDMRDRTEADVDDVLMHAMRQSFDLAADVLLRATVFQLGPEDALLGLSLHHIAADGWSLDILFKELSVIYEALLLGQAPELETLPIQFADYASWQRRTLEGPVLEEQLGYWRGQLEGAAPQLKLRSDMPRPAAQSFRGAIFAFKGSRELATLVANLCHTEEVTSFMALLTVLQIVLWLRSGQADVSVGSPIANRTQLETERLIGFFANTLVLRTVFPPHPTFREMLGRARETALGAYAHQHMPFERLVEILKPARSTYNPLFQVNFRVLTKPAAPLHFGTATAERVSFDPGTARFDLALELLVTADRFEGFFEYSTDLFLPQTIQQFRSDFEQTLRAVARHPDVPLSQLGLDRMAGTMPEGGTPSIRRRAARTSGIRA